VEIVKIQGGATAQVAKQDEVRLAVPATPEFLRLARVTAAGLASRLGFTFDQVEDLRLAIDELCFGLTGTKGRAGTVEVRFVLNDGMLEVHGTGHFDDHQEPPVLSELSQVILDALVDEHALMVADGGPQFRLVKRRGPTG
jgi:serine/threonine-protein kinase RsbW